MVCQTDYQYGHLIRYFSSPSDGRDIIRNGFDSLTCTSPLWSGYWNYRLNKPSWELSTPNVQYLYSRQVQFTIFIITIPVIHLFSWTHFIFPFSFFLFYFHFYFWHKQSYTTYNIVFIMRMYSNINSEYILYKYKYTCVECLFKQRNYSFI